MGGEFLKESSTEKNCPKGIVQGKPWGKNELVLSTNRNVLAQAIPYRKTKNNAESETRKKFQAPKIPYAPPEKKNLLNSSVDPELLCLRSLLLFDWWMKIVQTPGTRTWPFIL